MLSKYLPLSVQMYGIALGDSMLNRLTVSTLIKTVILATSFCVVVGFSLNAWDSWNRLQVASRISVVADASANLFKAMHNLRTDRSTTTRMLNSDAPMDPEIDKYLRNIRDTEMPAMGAAIVTLSTAGIPAAEDARARARPCLQDARRLAKGILGDDGQAEGAAPRRPAQAIHRYDQRPARRHGQALRHARRQRQPPGRHHRPVAGDQADRLAACATPRAKPR